MVADSHHFDEDPDPDQYLSEKLDPVTYESDLEPQPLLATIPDPEKSKQLWPTRI